MKKLLLLSSLLCSGCTTTTVVSQECVWAQPMRITAKEKALLSELTREQIGTHNCNYDKFCLNEDTCQ